ncbi:MAG: aquaporin-4 [Thermoleophilaceae bacterium]|nr:aquaporin-4 [Thermoleophilaceae bacterium]MEA2471094.1 aquaporin-4 [Thermoleophilaceae bacterium]
MEASAAKEPEDDKRTLGDDVAEDAAASTVADVIPARGPAAYVAEFIGTFALVLFITLAVSEFVTLPAASTVPGAPVVKPFIDWSVIGLVHVFVLFLLIQTLAVVSGAHFNPAVTAALTAVRQIRPIDAAIYIIMQLAGGVLGALVTKLILHNFDNAKAVHYGAPSVTDALAGKVGLGMLVEGIGAFFLVWAIIGVAVNPAAFREWAGLVIGATLGLVVMVAGGLTGASLNPARAFGPDLVAGKWDHFLLVYLIAPVIGALLAAFAYMRMFVLPGKKGPLGMGPVG